jgi:tRNA-splicing ligase RtcB
MSEDNYEVMESAGGRHIKMWTRGVPVENEAREQLARTSTMPFICRTCTSERARRLAA